MDEKNDMDYKELIDAFAAKYGVTDSLGSEGIEALDIDGTRVTFSEDASANAVILCATVGEMPADEKGVFASILLKASGILSASAEGAFCVDDNNVFHAVRSVSLSLADVGALASALESLVDLVEFWREHATAFADVDGELSRRAVEEAALNPLIGNINFIKV